MSFISYPSGNVAVVISLTEQGKFAYLVYEVSYVIFARISFAGLRPAFVIYLVKRVASGTQGIARSYWSSFF